MTDATPKFEWSCPREGCKRVIVTYTEAGRDSLAREHLKQHAREDSEHERVAEFKSQTKDYDTLELTLIDIGFLKTRGIVIDDKIELDLIHEPQPSKTELDQKRWARILHAAWDIIPPGDSNVGT